VNNNQQVHPIEFALAIALSSIESLLWIINELLGFHAQPPATATAPETALEAPQTSQTVTPDPFILKMTVKQLQAHTGIKSSRYNKARLIEYALNN
jgi:hypothetical protein